MIFKVSFGPYFANNDKQNLYVSFCESKTKWERERLNIFLHDLLSARKILSFPYQKFWHEFAPSISGVLLKCYAVVNDKNKVYCKLEQLMPYSPALNSSIFFSDRYNSIISSVIAREMHNRAAEEIRAEEDANVFAQLNQAAEAYIPRPVPAPVRRSLDYQGIARRTFVVDALPQGALPNYEGDINVDAAAVVEPRYPVNFHNITFTAPAVEVVDVNVEPLPALEPLPAFEDDMAEYDGMDFDFPVDP